MPQPPNDQQPTESTSLESSDTILPPKGVRVDIPTHDKNRSAFWSRQFAPTTTSGQIIFDVIFGIIAPILCLIADPVVFRGTINISGRGHGHFTSYAIIAYLLIATQILILLIALVDNGRSRMLSLVLAGPLLCGAFMSILIGLAILPLSIIGLFIIIGIFGFTPFFTAFVFLRNGVRSIKRAVTVFPSHIVVFVLIFTFIVALVIPIAVHSGIKRQVTSDVYSALEGSESERISAISRLKVFAMVFPPSEFDFLVLEYVDTKDEVRRARLNDTYKQVTGIDIERRWRMLTVD